MRIGCVGLLLLLAVPVQAADLSGTSHTLRGAHMNAGGAAALSHPLGSVGYSLGQPGAVGRMAGASHTLAAGFWPLAVPALLLDIVAQIVGVAQGGSISFSIDGVPLLVVTSPGDTAVQVVAAMAQAINDDPTLAAAGIVGAADVRALLSNGSLSDLIFNDGGLMLMPPPSIPSLPPAGLVLLLLAGLALLWRRRAAPAVAVLLLLLPLSSGAAPLLVNYQGQLLDGAGLPLTGVVSLSLDIWNDPVSTVPGDRLYGETHAAVSVQDGVFSVQLGGGIPTTGSFDAALLGAPALYLEVTVDGDVLAPRERLLAVPYAMRSNLAEESRGFEDFDQAFVTHYFAQTNFDGTGPNNTDPREGTADPDGDGLLNFLDDDNDGDGFDDGTEIANGTDINLVTPVVSDIVPGGAQFDETTTVTLSGLNFEPGMVVAFGSESPTPTNLTPTSFDVQVGPQPAAEFFVFVTHPSGETAAIFFAFGRTRIAFVTSATYDGNLGGLAGADAQCNALAAGASLPGSYLAWLADDTGSPATRFDLTGGPFLEVDGRLLARDWPDLTDGVHANLITLTELGTPAGTNQTAWTKVLHDGTLNAAATDCQEWTSNSLGDTGGVGFVGQFFNNQWTAAAAGFRTCSTSTRLYCVQQ